MIPAKRIVLDDIAEMERIDDECKHIRMNQYMAHKLKGKQPLNVFSDKLLMWPTHDLRFKRFLETDMELLRDMVASMRQKIVRKDLERGIVETVVELTSNLDEIERYNAVAADHNRNWEKAGSPRDVFDPITGDKHRIRDTYLDPVYLDSKLPESVKQDMSDGPLAMARPKIKREPVVKITYHLIVQSKQFVLEWIAYDMQNKVIHYDRISHANLSYLVRRSVQEIWGNPEETREFGKLLEGIPMLLRGEKLPLCKKHSRKPSIMDKSDKEKRIEPELMETELKQHSSNGAFVLFGYMVPVALLFSMLVLTLSCLLRGFEDGNTDPVRWQFSVGMCFIIGGLFASRWLAGKADREFSAVNAEKKFM